MFKGMLLVGLGGCLSFFSGLVYGGMGTLGAEGYSIVKEVGLYTGLELGLYGEDLRCYAFGETVA